MVYLKLLIELFVSVALFVNALLFIPQVKTLYQRKNSEGISLTTFLGFNLIQTVMLLHGLIRNDFILVFGMLLSLLTCGSISGMIIYYRYFKSR